MSDNQHPLPQLLEKDPKGHAEHRRIVARLSGFVLIAGLAVFGLAALNNLHGAASAVTTTQASNNEKAEPAPAPHYRAGLPVIPSDRAASALARSNYSKQDQVRILAALKRRDLSLIEMPIAEIDGKVGDRVRIDAGGFSQIVTLSDALKAVTLPIHHSGEVTISPIHMIAGNTLAAGVLTVYGMYSLPTLGSSELVTLDVVSQ